ncbi:MAG TPA: tryptophanase [Clostridia bacterium]|nr:tryptophanase [Clostridia bacterium]
MRQRWEYMEPYKIKMIEPIKQTTRQMREQYIQEAGYNIFNLRGEDVYIDLLTDSGTTAMSDNQWSGMMLGDESYAGSKNFYHFQRAVEDIIGFPYVVPTHQGRGAENILMKTMGVKKGCYVLANMHFDTTEGHVLEKGAEPVNLICPEGKDIEKIDDFKGNIDVEALEEAIKEYGVEKIPFILLTVTCNSNGGQPVSMANIKATRSVADRYGIPLYFDAARFVENCYFIKEREKGYQSKSIIDIAREMFSYADGCTMSAKKDALVNIGGFLATRHQEIYEKAVEFQIIFEGFKTYGGLAGRDLEAMARGLYEGLEEAYLEDRIGQVAYLGDKLRALDVPIMYPTGGHGVFVECKKFLPHLPQSQFPAQALIVELYIEGGIRGVELGSCCFGRKDPETGEDIYPALELVRLAIPRRVYTDRHMDYIARTFERIVNRKDQIRGMKLIHEAPVLRHFTARFEWL